MMGREQRSPHLYPLPPAGGEGGVRGCGRTNFFRQSPGQHTSAFARAYQMTLLQCLWMVASLVTRLACATIAAATINRSKGSRVHARPTASFTMEWNDCGAVSRSISSRRAANTTSGPFMIRLISNRYCSSSVTIGDTNRCSSSSAWRAASLRRSVRPSNSQQTIACRDGLLEAGQFVPFTHLG